jgi:hypothetical protein
MRMATAFDILEAVRPAVDVDRMPWCDISGRVRVNSKITLGSQATVRVSRTFCNDVPH